MLEALDSFHKYRNPRQKQAWSLSTKIFDSNYQKCSFLTYLQPLENILRTGFHNLLFIASFSKNINVYIIWWRSVWPNVFIKTVTAKSPVEPCFYKWAYVLYVTCTNRMHTHGQRFTYPAASSMLELWCDSW